MENTANLNVIVVKQSVSGKVWSMVCMVRRHATTQEIKNDSNIYGNIARCCIHVFGAIKYIAVSVSRCSNIFYLFGCSLSKQVQVKSSREINICV